MCTKPNIINGYEISCRECDQCMATYKNTWVARSMAERNSVAYTYAFTLTYADVEDEKTGEKRPPLGARVYHYQDVSDFWKRLRERAVNKWKERIDFRYVVVGEKGTKNGRVHYHGVMFSSHPVIELGVMHGALRGGFAYKRRLDWDVWGHGYVEFQKATRKGIAYCLKYIMKGRMTDRRSVGFRREGKTEWLASSRLWCSKTPAVGETWLWTKINDGLAKGRVTPSLRIPVQGGGEWYVAGELQKQMCLYLREANIRYREERGRDLSGWETLLQSCDREIELSDTGEMVKRKAWEWLVNGEEVDTETEELTPQQIEEQREEFDEWYREKQKRSTRYFAAQRAVEKCGNIIPCDECADRLTDAERTSLRQEYLFRKEEWQARRREGAKRRKYYDGDFQTWWRTRLRPSRGCLLRHTPEQQQKFRTLVGRERGDPRNTERAAIGKALQRPPGQQGGKKRQRR